MGVVDQAIQDGIGQGGIPDLGVAFIHRELRGHESGTETVTIFEEFQEVPALFIGQGGYSPVVQGDQIGFRQDGQELGITPIPFGDLEVLEETGETKIANRVAFSTGFMGQGTGQEGFTASRGPGDEYIVMLLHPEELDEAELERKLFPPPPLIPFELRPIPNWPEIHQELRRKGMTLFLLWEEHRQVNPDSFQYSWFCEHYNQWAGKLDLVMRQHHRAGEKTFLDYAGQTVPVINATTGEMREAQIFLAVLGASSYTYAEATWTQQLPDWIASHVRAFIFFGGVSEILVPDNLKSGVSKTCRSALQIPQQQKPFRRLLDHPPGRVDGFEKKGEGRGTRKKDKSGC